MSSFLTNSQSELVCQWAPHDMSFHEFEMENPETFAAFASEFRLGLDLAGNLYDMSQDLLADVAAILRQVT